MTNARICGRRLVNCTQAICIADILGMVCFALPSLSLVLPSFRKINEYFVLLIWWDSVYLIVKWQVLGIYPNSKMYKYSQRQIFKTFHWVKWTHNPIFTWPKCPGQVIPEHADHYSNYRTLCKGVVGGVFSARDLRFCYLSHSSYTHVAELNSTSLIWVAQCITRWFACVTKEMWQMYVPPWATERTGSGSMQQNRTSFSPLLYRTGPKAQAGTTLSAKSSLSLIQAWRSTKRSLQAIEFWAFCSSRMSCI